MKQIIHIIMLFKRFVKKFITLLFFIFFNSDITLLQKESSENDIKIKNNNKGKGILLYCSSIIAYLLYLHFIGIIVFDLEKVLNFFEVVTTLFTTTLNLENIHQDLVDLGFFNGNYAQTLAVVLRIAQSLWEEGIVPHKNFVFVVIFLYSRFIDSSVVTENWNEINNVEFEFILRDCLEYLEYFDAHEENPNKKATMRKILLTFVSFLVSNDGFQTNYRDLYEWVAYLYKHLIGNNEDD